MAHVEHSSRGFERDRHELKRDSRSAREGDRESTDHGADHQDR